MHPAEPTDGLKVPAVQFIQGALPNAPTVPGKQKLEFEVPFGAEPVEVNVTPVELLTGAVPVELIGAVPLPPPAPVDEPSFVFKNVQLSAYCKYVTPSGH